jgi:hypothetical protein
MWMTLSSLRQFVMGSAGMGTLLLGLPVVWAGCPDCPDCQHQTVSYAAVSSPMSDSMEMMNSGSWDPSVQYQSVPTPYPAQSTWDNSPQYQPTPVLSAPSPAISTWDNSPQYRAAPPPSGVARSGWAVVTPPGTLGQTYQRQSWPIPKNEHPRTAIIQVTASGFTQMQVDGLADMEGFQRPDGAWIFKSKQPLTPGVPHIYHVKAGYKNTENTSWNVRTVRLIPGRVVTLEY